MRAVLHFPREINHKGLFLFGFIFYLVCPLIILQTDLFDGLPGIDGWKENVLDHAHVIRYLLLLAWIIVPFYMGSHIGSKYVNIRYSKVRTLGPLSGKFVLAFMVIFVVYFFYKARGSAFQGHALDNDDDNNLEGIMATTNLLLFYIHFVIDQPKSTKRGFLFLLIFNSLFLLGLGGRMYVIIPLVAYFARGYNRAAQSGKPVWPYFLVPAIVAVTASIIGALRVGDSLDKIGFFIFAEPIFTSWSAFSYLNHNAIPLAAVPLNFLVGFLNIIPSLLWPAKGDVLNGMVTGWITWDSPMGALSVFVSIYANFGVIFGGVFMFFVGAFFGQLYKAFKTGNINRNVYYCFCAVLAFCFFRDPFSLPIKIYILSFFLIPFGIQLVKKSLEK